MIERTSVITYVLRIDIDHI